MDNATPLKKAKKPVNKFFLITSVFMLIVVFVGAYYLTIYKPSTVKPKATECDPGLHCGTGICPGNSSPLIGRYCSSNGTWLDSCTGYDGCARQIHNDQSCAGLSGYSSPKTPSNFVGCCGRKNCFCNPPGGSGTVSCVDSSTSCGLLSSGSCTGSPQTPTNTPIPIPTPITPECAANFNASCAGSTATISWTAPGNIPVSLYVVRLNHEPYDPLTGHWFNAAEGDQSLTTSTTSISATVEMGANYLYDVQGVTSDGLHGARCPYLEFNCSIPTAIPVPPTATLVPPTATPVPPTATPVPPTATPVLPTATPTPTTPPGQPTNTPAPTATNTPGPTATPIPVPCGTKSCDNATNPCSSGYNCVQANDGSNYCTSPDFANACKVNPSYDSCCSAPGAPTATPTEIILAKISTSPAVVKLLQTGVVQSFMYFIPALIMLIGLIL